MEASNIHYNDVCFEYVERVSDWFESQYDGIIVVKFCLTYMLILHKLVYDKTKDAKLAVSTALGCDFMKILFSYEEIQQACCYAKDLMDVDE